MRHGVNAVEGAAPSCDRGQPYEGVQPSVQGAPPLLLTQAGALVHDMEFGPDRPGPSTIRASRSVSRSRIRLDLTGMTHLDQACRDQVEEFTA
ncbi:hypothetical protein [Streptomyces mirabilis]|uniref:hypothetical protein n=1 Tax=Streptomyces mirabilis TaxID=68239 RepID=UPI003696A267